jgi:hypothetical protein
MQIINDLNNIFYFCLFNVWNVYIWNFIINISEIKLTYVYNLNCLK